MHSNQLYFSVIICTRNRAESLGRTLEFYTKLESNRAWELIVVNNLSTDNTNEVIDSFKSKIDNLVHINCDQVGLGAARELARQSASGEILVFTDDDCYPNQNYLICYEQVFSEPSIQFASGRILLWDESDAKVTVDYRENVVEYPAFTFVSAGSLQGANIAFRAKSLEVAGGIDPSLGAGTDFPSEDIDAVARMVFSGFSGRFDPRPIVYHHHGRREREIPKLMKAYDMGRGAYYMKLLLMPEARVKALNYYSRNVMKAMIKKPKVTLITTYREIYYGLKYLMKYGIKFRKDWKVIQQGAQQYFKGF